MTAPAEVPGVWTCMHCLLQLSWTHGDVCKSMAQVYRMPCTLCKGESGPCQQAHLGN